MTELELKAHSWEDLAVGMEESFEVKVTTAMIDAFAALSGDVNPLHTDSHFAVGRGFKGRVCHGMLTASFYSTLVGMRLPGRDALLQGVDASFHSPVFDGERLTVKGVVGNLNEAYRQMEIKATIRGADGRRVSKALIRVGLPTP